MTLREAYEYGKEQLHLVNIDDADLDAWYLLEYATGINHTMYYLKMQEEISSEQGKLYCSYIEKRANHIPLQHITGVQEFMGLEFLVNEHVLVPRQDTEILVETVLKDLKSGMNVLDMCTGSGCILISLLKFCEGVVGEGVDLSDEALEVACQNGNKLNVSAEFVKSDLFENVSGTYDIIVSNPPYIRTSAITELKEEVKCHDPFMALDGKEDGLHFYRKIVEESPNYLKQGGKLYFEIGYDQSEAVKSLMEEAGFAEIAVKKDLAGLDRVVFGRYN